MTDLVELAERLAEVARKTIDPDAGRALMDIVHELLTESGLPADGGDLSTSWLSDPVCAPT